MISIEDEISVPALTAIEIAWIKRLHNLLGKCPERLELMTKGDTGISIIDGNRASESELADGAAREDGIVLADIINIGPIVHGVS